MSENVKKNESTSDEAQEDELNDRINVRTDADLQITSDSESDISQRLSTSSNAMSAYDDEPPICVSVANNMLSYVMNLPSGPFSKGSKSSEVIKDMMPITIEQMDHQTKVKLLQCQLQDLKNQVIKAKKRLEDARKDRNEVVEFMRESCQNAERDVIRSHNKVEYYRELLAHKRAAAAGRIELYRSPNADPVYTVAKSDVRLMILASMYLSLHTQGISIDSICSYLSNFAPGVRAQNVENLLRLFRSMFREETTGTPPNVERNWKFLSFK